LGEILSRADTTDAAFDTLSNGFGPQRGTVASVTGPIASGAENPTADSGGPLPCRTVKTVRLTDPKGFILFDLADAPASVGVARSAPSVLIGGAESMARSVTYSMAVFGIRAGGASAAVNAKPDELAPAVAALVAKAVEVGEGRLGLDPSRNVTADDLAPLRAHDPRPPWVADGPIGANAAARLVAAGALAAGDAMHATIDGGRVAIEGFDVDSLALLEALTERGARVVAVGTSAGTAEHAEGFDPAVLAERADQGPGMVKSLVDKPRPAWAIFGADADVLFVGSRPGVLSHEGAAHVKARTVLATGAVPFSTKAMLVMQRAGTVVVPDFLSIAGPHIAAFDPAIEPATAADTVRERIGGAVVELSQHPNGLFLGACEQAEAFLSTWQESLPFGRPLAA